MTTEREDKNGLLACASAEGRQPAAGGSPAFPSATAYSTEFEWWIANTLPNPSVEQKHAAWLAWSARPHGFTPITQLTEADHELRSSVATPIAWVATKDDGANLHFALADGWKIEPVLFSPDTRPTIEEPVKHRPEVQECLDAIDAHNARSTVAPRIESWMAEHVKDHKYTEWCDPCKDIQAVLSARETRQMAKTKQPKDDPIKAAKKYLADYPQNYDAMRDGLSTREDHAMSVNELLRHLRAVVAAADRGSERS